MTVKEYNDSIDLHADALYRFILKSIKNEDASKDIVQDTFEKVWLKRSSVSAEKAKSYLFTTAYRTMVDKIRKGKFEQNIGEKEELSFIGQSNQYSELGEVLEKALDTLPEQQKTLVLLRDYEGYNYKEIGEICNLTESQVKVYIFRARKSLQKYLVSVNNVLGA